MAAGGVAVGNAKPPLRPLLPPLHPQAGGTSHWQSGHELFPATRMPSSPRRVLSPTLPPHLSPPPRPLLPLPPPFHCRTTPHSHTTRSSPAPTSPHPATRPLPPNIRSHSQRHRPPSAQTLPPLTPRSTPPCRNLLSGSPVKLRHRHIKHGQHSKVPRRVRWEGQRRQGVVRLTRTILSDREGV